MPARAWLVAAACPATVLAQALWQPLSVVALQAQPLKVDMAACMSRALSHAGGKLAKAPRMRVWIKNPRPAREWHESFLAGQSPAWYIVYSCSAWLGSTGYSP